MPINLVPSTLWYPQGGQIYATDPLTLNLSGLIAVPEAPARVLGFMDQETGRTAALALLWDTSPVVCGHDLGTVGVDTGLAAFLTPTDLSALLLYSEAYGDDLYSSPVGAQLDATVPTIPTFVSLPDGTRFPVSGTGWGDGGYPVASLHDADGTMVALYAQFMGGTEDWLLPTPCTDQTS